MLSRDYLRERADEYRIALKNRGASVDLERFVELDAERRRTIARVEQLKNQRNTASQEIAQLKKNKQDASAQIDTVFTQSGVYFGAFFCMNGDCPRNARITVSGRSTKPGNIRSATASR